MLDYLVLVFLNCVVTTLRFLIQLISSLFILQIQDLSVINQHNLEDLKHLAFLTVTTLNSQQPTFHKQMFHIIFAVLIYIHVSYSSILGILYLQNLCHLKVNSYLKAPRNYRLNVVLICRSSRNQYTKSFSELINLFYQNIYGTMVLMNLN